MSKKYMSIFPAANKELKEVLKSYINRAVESEVEDTGSSIIIVLSGFGLVGQMEDIMDGKFSHFIIDDFRAITNHDCFKGFEWATGGCAIIGANQMSPPSIKFILKKQTVAIER